MTPPVADTAAPKVTKATASGTLKRALVKFSSNEDAKVTARLTRQGQTRTLTSVTRSLKARARQLTITRGLSDGKRYRVALRIVDAAGNTSMKTITFTAHAPE